MKSERQRELDTLFEDMFREYQQPILNYLYRLVGDAVRAEELTQDAFVKAYRALHRLPADANSRGWLYRIATNTAYDYLRRRRIVQWVPLLEKDYSLLAKDGPESTIAEQGAVQRSLSKLPLSYRVPLILYSVEGYSVNEIGEMLGISQGAVKTRLCRAREKMRKVFREESSGALP